MADDPDGGGRQTVWDMGFVAEKPWWRRDYWDQASRTDPWTSIQRRFHRVGFVFVFAVGFAIAAATSNAVLAAIPAILLAPEVYRWTPYQRRQFIGRRPPRDHS
jgi:hypothetical protein